MLYISPPCLLEILLSPWNLTFTLKSCCDLEILLSPWILAVIFKPYFYLEILMSPWNLTITLNSCCDLETLLYLEILLSPWNLIITLNPCCHLETLLSPWNLTYWSSTQVQNSFLNQNYLQFSIYLQYVIIIAHDLLATNLMS